VILVAFEALDIDDRHRRVVDRHLCLDRQSGGEVVGGGEIKNVDQSQYISARYTVDLVLFIVVCRSLEVHLANYSVALENTTVSIICSLNRVRASPSLAFVKLRCYYTCPSDTVRFRLFRGC
jgi:hypothetical protein